MLLKESSLPNRKYPEAVSERYFSSSIERAATAGLPRPPSRRCAMTWNPIARAMLEGEDQQINPARIESIGERTNGLCRHSLPDAGFCGRPGCDLRRPQPTTSSPKNAKNVLSATRPCDRNKSMAQARSSAHATVTQSPSSSWYRSTVELKSMGCRKATSAAETRWVRSAALKSLAHAGHGALMFWAAASRT